MAHSPHWRLFILLVILVSSVVYRSSGQRPLPSDLGNSVIVNGGWEDPLTSPPWARIHGEYIGRVAGGHNGSEHCLRISVPPGTTTANVIRAIHAVPVQGGEHVYMRGWTRGVNVKDANQQDAYGSFYIEAQGLPVNADDKPNSQGLVTLGSSYPAPNDNAKGTYGWTFVESRYQVHENATKLSVGATARRLGNTGEMYFDNLELFILPPPLVDALVRYPTYRGTTVPSDPRPWELDIKGTVPAAHPPSTLTVTLRNDTGTLLHKESHSVAPGKYHIKSIWPPQAPAVGIYHWQVHLQGITPEFSETQNLTVTVQNSMPKVYIDGDGYTVRNNARFFPLILYTGSGGNTNADIDRFAEGGFNTVLSYSYGDELAVTQAQEFVDYANTRGLSVIYSLTKVYETPFGRQRSSGGNYYPRNGVSAAQQRANYVIDLKDRPNLLGWYTNDEVPVIEVPHLKEAYDQLRTLDPHHPVIHVVTPSQTSPGYQPSMDVWGNDPYPISGSRIRTVTDSGIQRVVNYSRGTKGIWQVVQAYTWTNKYVDGPHRFPTLEEMRNMSYQNLIGGAKGLFFYNYHDLGKERDEEVPGLFETRWSLVTACLADIRPLTSYILANQPVEAELVQVTGGYPTSVLFKAWSKEGSLALALANVSEDTITAKIRLNGNWKLAQQQNSALPFSMGGDVVTVQLAPIASGTVYLDQAGSTFWLQ